MLNFSRVSRERRPRKRRPKTTDLENADLETLSVVLERPLHLKHNDSHTESKANKTLTLLQHYHVQFTKSTYSLHFKIVLRPFTLL